MCSTVFVNQFIQIICRKLYLKSQLIRSSIESQRIGQTLR